MTAEAALVMGLGERGVEATLYPTAVPVPARFLDALGQGSDPDECALAYPEPPEITEAKARLSSGIHLDATPSGYRVVGYECPACKNIADARAAKASAASGYVTLTAGVAFPPAPLDVCPKCGRGEMHPGYVAAKASQCSNPACTIEHRRSCRPEQSLDREGDCPESEHLHERCAVCRYERVAQVAQ